jgi:RNA-directed DNA polymerase
MTPLDLNAWASFFYSRVSRRRAIVRGYLAYLREMNAKALPPIFEGDHLARLLGVTPLELISLTQSQEWHYRTFTIPKRSGGRRPITVPSALLLHTQRWIRLNILDQVAVHEAAQGYVPGRSHLANAKAHLEGREILTVDIESFFPSITERRVIGLFGSFGYPPNVSYLLSRLCTYAGEIPQGAATSPALSNLVMRVVDARLSGLARSTGLIYTRYVDDITFSGARINKKIEDIIRMVLREEGFQLNDGKTRYYKGSKKIVTGVSVSSGRLKLPRQARRQLKNDAYHLLRRTRPTEGPVEPPRDPLEMERLMGRLAYWLSIESENKTAASLFKEIRELSRFRQ